MSKSILPKFGRAARREEKQQQAVFAQSLHDMAGQTRPDPDFAARLKGDLLARRVETLAQDIRPNFWRQAMFKKLAFAATILIVAMASVGLYSWLRGGQNAGELPLLPRLVSAAGGGVVIQDGLLSGAEVILGVDLPAAPQSAPVYSVTFTFPTTSEEALAWARNFGLSNPQIYHNPDEPEAISVVGGDGRTLTFSADGPAAGVRYMDDAAAMTPGAGASFEQTRDAAVAFLSAHGLLPEHYRVEESPLSPIWQWGKRVWMVSIVPELDEHPLITDATGAIWVMTNSAGDVTQIIAPLWAFTQLHGYPIKTAQEAWDELLAGDAFRLEIMAPSPNSVHSQIFYRDASELAVGDAVTVTGWVQALIPEQAGQAGGAQMITPGGSRYLLDEIPNADELVRESTEIQVSGVVIEILGPQYRRLAVQRCDVATPRMSSESRVGTFRREGDAAWLVDDNDVRYALPDAPADLEDGARIEAFVSGDVIPGATLDWEAISTLLTFEDNVATTVMVQAEPLPTPEVPYTIGQTVELTGMVNATLIIESDQQWYETYLQMIPGDFNNYKLIGDETTMAALAQLHRLHIRVQGQVVTATLDWGGEGPAIVVDGYTQVLPDERRYRLLGTFTQETLDGQLVAVFTECSNGQRYVVDADPHNFPQEYFGAERDSSLQVEVHGTLPALTTVGGLPQLQIEASMHGSDISQLPCDAPRPIAPGPEVQDRTGRDNQVRRNAFTVDRAELAYYYEYAPLPLLSSTVAQPVWIFSGLSGDGATRFTAYVQAARETYIAR